MTLVRDLILLGHFLGFSLLVGGCLVQFRAEKPEISLAMFSGAVTQFITGVALLVTAEGGYPHAKAGVKMGLLLIVLVLVVANRRWESIPRGVWAIITIGSLADAAIAVLWH